MSFTHCALFPTRKSERIEWIEEGRERGREAGREGGSEGGMKVGPPPSKQARSLSLTKLGYGVIMRFKLPLFDFIDGNKVEQSMSLRKKEVCRREGRKK